MIAARTDSSFSSAAAPSSGSEAAIATRPRSPSARALPSRNRGSGQPRLETSGPTAASPIKASASTASARSGSSPCPRFSIKPGIASFASPPIMPSALAAPRRMPVSSLFKALINSGRAAAPIFDSANDARSEACSRSRGRKPRPFRLSVISINRGTASFASGPISAMAAVTSAKTCGSESPSAAINCGSIGFAPAPSTRS